MRLSDKMTLTRHELDEVYDNLGEQITVALHEMFEYGQEAERERIIKLLEDSEELQSHIYFWLEFGENDTEGRDRKALSIALIKGENK